MIMSTELVLTGKLHRSHRTVSMGSPGELVEKQRAIVEVMSSVHDIQNHFPPDVFLCSPSPALVRPPFLDVAYVVDGAVNCHVIVVAGDVEGTAEFYGALQTEK